MDTRDDTFPTDTTPATGGAGPRAGRPARITRSRDDRMLGGVCGGIAKYFDLDPVLVRVATVTLVCAVGVGAVAYVAAWILMPLDDSSPAPATPAVAPHRPATA